MDSAHVDLQESTRTAGEIHDELARRIRSVGEDAASEADLAAAVERVERLEPRLDDLEDRLSVRSSYPGRSSGRPRQERGL